MDSVLANSIRNVPHLKVFDEIVAERINNLDLTKLLIYLIDVVDAKALPILGEQFDVLGYKGWILTTNETEQRELLKNAIKLHRYKGTVYAIKECLKSVGFTGAEVLEGVTVPARTYDGSFDYDGSVTYESGSTSPFNFSILIDSDQVSLLTPAKRSLVVKLIKEYQNIRSRLVSIVYQEAVRPKYNNNFTYDGTIKYDYQYYIINVNV